VHSFYVSETNAARGVVAAAEKQQVAVGGEGHGVTFFLVDLERGGLRLLILSWTSVNNLSLTGG